MTAPPPPGKGSRLTERIPIKRPEDRYAWKNDAYCKGRFSPNDFVPSEMTAAESTALMNRAKDACAPCPVKQQCLDYAIEEGHVYGVFGGMTPRQRKNEIARRERA